MFDGLKDKLGRFRKDVEERTEEPEEHQEAAAAGEAPAVGEGTDAEADQAAETADPEESEPVDETGDRAEPEPRTPGEPESAAEARRDVKSEAAEASAVEGAGEADAEEPPTSEEDLSLGRRARMFATGKTLITEEDVEEPLEELELALLQGDVELSVANSIVERLREELIGAERAQVETGEAVVTAAIGDALREVISVGQFDFAERLASTERPVTIVFTGVNGVGKTTTIAKMARYLEERGYSTVIANGDTYRAGANEQVREHADNLGVKLISHQQGGDPAAVIYDAVEYAEANDVDVVLGDTAGRLHTASDLMAQLEKIDRVVDPDLTLFVDEAVAGQDATERAREFDDAAEIDGAVLTKADADSQGGAAISIAHVTGKPILFLGTGQGYDDLERFDPDVIVDRLVGEE